VRKTILVVVAHADDLEYNIGGTIARFVDEGHDVYRVAITDSAGGTLQAHMTRERMAAIGQEEARRASAVLGIKGDYFLGFPDSILTDVHSEAIRRQLIRLIRQLKVNTVISWDPWGDFDDHPDHVVAARAAYWAAEFAPFPLIPPNANDSEPCYVVERYFFAKHPLPQAQTAVDITPYLDRKIEALWQYESQMRLAYDMYVAYQKALGVSPKQWPKRVSADNYKQVLAETIRREAKESGEPYGIPYAEIFRYVRNEPRYP